MKTRTTFFTCPGLFSGKKLSLRGASTFLVHQMKQIIWFCGLCGLRMHVYDAKREKLNNHKKCNISMMY